MSASLQVDVTGVDTVHDIPGRFGEGGLRELVTALDGTVGDDEEVYDALVRTFSALPLQALAERLLDAVLLKPPIPAGCEALVHAMATSAGAPWRTHEVVEDRVWLWYCHSLLHRAFPDRFEAPAVTRVTWAVTQLDPDARVPGRRTAPHDRTTFVARTLAARPGAEGLSDDLDRWAFDRVWWVEVTDRVRADADDLAARGASAEAAASGRCFLTTVQAWMPEGEAVGLSVGQTWGVAG